MRILKKCLFAVFGSLTITGVLAVVGAVSAWAEQNLSLPDAIKIVFFSAAVILISAKVAEFFYEESED